jgi:hypothetical protein
MTTVDAMTHHTITVSQSVVNEYVYEADPVIKYCILNYC